MKRLNLKKLVVLTAVTALSLTLTACGSKETAESTNAKEAVRTVRIACPGQGDDPTENALLAKKLGYIDEELKKVGYEADFIGFAQVGPAINEAFAAEEVDVAFYNEFPAIVAKSNGIDIKLYAAVTSEMNYALFATNDSGIKSVKDLEGKKVIITPGTILYKYFNDLCQKNGVDTSKIEQINAIADANSVLASGEADAYVCALSSGYQLESQSIGSVIADTTQDLSESTGIGLFARTAYADENADAVKALIRALKRSGEYASGDAEGAYEKLVTNNFSIDVIKKIYAYDTTFSYYTPEITDAYRERIEAQYNFIKENKLISSDVVLDDLIDTTYVDEVLAE